MHKVLLWITVLTICLQGTPLQEHKVGSSVAILKNADIIALHASGFTDAILAAKIETSDCDFDTTPQALAKLKESGLQESVILAMIKKGSTSAHPVGSNCGVGTTTTTAPIVGYELSYVKSDRKWKYGLRSEPFDKISDYAEKQVAATLEHKGVHRVSAVSGGCCLVVIDLLEVTVHPAAIKKPGIDVSANVSVRDSTNRLVYSKGYRGESRTLLNTWGHLIDHAVEDMANNIAADPDLIGVLSSGRLD